MIDLIHTQGEGHREELTQVLLLVFIQVKHLIFSDTI